jgi:hypothetical protein
VPREHVRHVEEVGDIGGQPGHIGADPLGFGVHVNPDHLDRRRQQPQADQQARLRAAGP